jgi:hypothetical protein
MQTPITRCNLFASQALALTYRSHAIRRGGPCYPPKAHLSRGELALAVVEWESSLRVQRSSRRAEELFGSRAEEVMGLAPSEQGGPA